LHNFKIFWDTIGYTEKHKKLSKGAREYMGDMERYWDITEGSGTSWGTRRESGP
jgi:hypothetical protein